MLHTGIEVQYFVFFPILVPTTMNMLSTWFINNRNSIFVLILLGIKQHQYIASTLTNPVLNFPTLDCYMDFINSIPELYRSAPKSIKSKKEDLFSSVIGPWEDDLYLSAKCQLCCQVKKKNCQLFHCMRIKPVSLWHSCLNGEVKLCNKLFCSFTKDGFTWSGCY